MCTLLLHVFTSSFHQYHRVFETRAVSCRFLSDGKLYLVVLKSGAAPNWEVLVNRVAVLPLSGTAWCFLPFHGIPKNILRRRTWWRGAARQSLRSPGEECDETVTTIYRHEALRISTHSAFLVSQVHVQERSEGHLNSRAQAPYLSSNWQSPFSKTMIV